MVGAYRSGHGACTATLGGTLAGDTCLTFSLSDFPGMSPLHS